MQVFSYLELYTTLIAWQLYGVIYDVIAQTGLILIPLAWAIIGIATQSVGEKRTDNHEIPIGQLKAVLQMVIVLFFCLIPIYQVSPSEINYQRSPTVGVPQIEVNAESDRSTYHNSIPTGNNAISIPAWWGLMHKFSTGITHAVIQSLPSHADLREARVQLTARNIEDADLAQDYREFLGMCYHPAKRNYQRLRLNEQIPPAPENAALDWAGSPYFITMPGGYAACTHSSHCQGAPHFLPPMLAARISTNGNTNETLEVTCADWWEIIRHRILEQAREDQSAWNAIFSSFTGTLSGLSGREREDLLVRNTLENFAVRDISTDQTRFFVEEGWSLNSAANQGADLLGALSGVGAWIKLEVVVSIMVQAIPIMVAILMLFLIVMIPFALLFTGYRIRAVVSLSFLLFTAIFVHALLAVAVWLDHTLTLSLFDNLSETGNFQQALNWLQGRGRFFGDWQKRMLVNIVLMVNCLIVPLVWFKTMHAVGLRAATGMGDAMAGGNLGSGQIMGQQAASVAGGSGRLARTSASRFAGPLGRAAGSATKKFRH